MKNRLVIGFIAVCALAIIGKEYWDWESLASEIPQPSKIPQATIPFGYKVRPFPIHTIADMFVGEVAWTAPWDMIVDKNKKYWLNPVSFAEPSFGGTLTIRVTREKDGFSVVNESGYPLDLKSDDGSFYLVEKGKKNGVRPWIPVTTFTN